MAGRRAGHERRPLLGARPLHELTRDQLSVFLYVALLPDETRELVKRLGPSMPGSRREALGDVERCDLIADEIRAAPRTAGEVQEVLRGAFQEPPLAAHPLDPGAAAELVRACSGDSALALALWRVPILGSALELSFLDAARRLYTSMSRARAPSSSR